MSYRALRIEFEYKNSRNNNKKLNGTAFYILDKNNKILRQIPQIEFGTTWQIKHSYGIKFKYKDKRPKLEKELGIDINSSQKNYQYELNKNQIEKINKFLNNSKNSNTILNLDNILTGSHPSGSEQYHYASPYIIKDKSKYNGFRFINFLNKICKSEKTAKINVKLEEVTEYINLEKFLLLNEKYLPIFFSYNSEKFDITNSNMNEKQNNIFFDYLNDFYHTDLSNYRKQIKEIISIKNILSNNELEKIIKKLRRIFKNTLWLEAKQILVNDCNYLTYKIKQKINKNHNEVLQAAHIISVKYFKEKYLETKDIKILYNIGNYNNGLLLTPTRHTEFDKNIISFQNTGNIISKNNTKIKEYVLKKSILNCERNKFLKENYNNYISTHKNL